MGGLKIRGYLKAESGAYWRYVRHRRTCTPDDHDEGTSQSQAPGTSHTHLINFSRFLFFFAPHEHVLRLKLKVQISLFVIKNEVSPKA